MRSSCREGCHGPARTAKLTMPTRRAVANYFKQSIYRLIIARRTGPIAGGPRAQSQWATGIEPTFCRSAHEIRECVAIPGAAPDSSSEYVREGQDLRCCFAERPAVRRPIHLLP